MFNNYGFNEYFGYGFTDNTLELVGESTQNINVILREVDDRYIIEGKFPGVNRKDIKIQYKDENIYVNVPNSQYFSSNNTVVVMQSSKDFNKVFHVPNADPGKLRVAFKNGFLRLQIPKLYGEDTEIIDVVDFEEE